MSGQGNGGVFSPMNLSLFTYTYNNPVILVDPDGNVVKAAKTLFNIAHKTYKKLDNKDFNLNNFTKALKDSGIDEGADILGDLYTIVDPSASYFDKAKATFDIISGFETNNKGKEKAYTLLTGKKEGYQADAMFLGGAKKQDKVSLERSKHIALHSDMNTFLRNVTDKEGYHMRPQRGNKGTKIQRNFTRDQMLDAQGAFYKVNQHKYPEVAEQFFKQNPGLK